MEINEAVLRNTKHFTKTYQKMVYIAIHLDNRLSVKEIADICVCSVNIVRQSIKHLESLGLVAVERKMAEDGTHLPNEYYILDVPETFREGK